MAKETISTRQPRVPRQPKNDNLGSFVDAVTPTPKLVLENFLKMDVLGDYNKKASPEQKDWVHQMIDIALSSNKKEEFLSIGEQIALNTLRRMNILV